MTINELRDEIQEEYNEHVETDINCELTDSELEESFWSNAICTYNDNNINKCGFVINNGVVEIVEY